MTPVKDGVKVERLSARYPYWLTDKESARGEPRLILEPHGDGWNLAVAHRGKELDRRNSVWSFAGVIMANFQRNGSISNTHVGKDFEAKTKSFFAAQGIILDKNISIEIGIEDKKKAHNFDLGDLVNKIIVECKSHTWTKSENTPSVTSRI